jgi:hypothetical protein
VQKILYTMHFVGRTSRTSESPDIIRTSGTATSCVFTTLVSTSGVQTDLRASEGGLAFFESELRMTGATEFEESGEIAFGDEGENVLRFSMRAHGHVQLDVGSGIMASSACWKVNGGSGQFAGAQGFITSTFTLSESGERSDYQCGLIFVPG